MDKLPQILKEIGFDYAYSHFEKGEEPARPYICFMNSSSSPFSADGRIYQDYNGVDLELYTDRKDPEAENKVRSVLDRHSIVYSRSESWLPEEERYQVWFSFEMED